MRSTHAETAAAQKILLLGLGNDFLTDDAVGLCVAAGARELLGAHPNLSITESSEMGLGLLDLIIGFEILIIVDAIQTKSVPPGFIHELSESDLARLTSISPHFVGVGELLALGRELGLNVPHQLKIFAIEVEDPFTIGRRMTPALRAGLPQIIQQVVDFCESVAQEGLANGGLVPALPAFCQTM